MYRIPSNPLDIIHYAFRALGQKSVSVKKLRFFLSFDLRLMPPSKADKMIKNLYDKGLLIIDDDLVSIAHDSRMETPSKMEAPSSPANLGDMLNQFVSSSRLSRAVGIEDKAIKIEVKSRTPLRIEAIIHGTRDYKLFLDEESRIIRHDCPDWEKVSMIHRFCKHVAKIFLSLEKDEAIRLLLSIQRESWQFEKI